VSTSVGPEVRFFFSSSSQEQTKVNDWHWRTTTVILICANTCLSLYFFMD
jgi:hypothetical protein